MTHGESRALSGPAGPRRPRSRTNRTVELRSIELHRIVAQRLRENPALLDRAREQAEQLPGRCRDAWLGLLAGPLNQTCAELTADNEKMRDLRQTAPFNIGIVTEAERLRIIRDVHE